ncbi:MAG: hypothetical protein HPY59_07845 [Anaerolineae bacterium]|nr:hypothetical protein [Anaerolineae bacterium]
MNNIDSRTRFRATHTVETYTGIEDVRLIGKTKLNLSLWIDRQGRAYQGLRDFLPIPGRNGDHKLHLEHAKWINHIPDPVANSNKAMLALLDWSWSKPEMRIAVKPDDLDRIVRGNGCCWILKSNAAAVLRSLGIGESHCVDGFGNSGPRGREWWLRTKFRGFSLSTYRLNGDSDPLNEYSHWTIDVQGGPKNDAQLLWELKYFGRQWQIAFKRRDGGVCLGFSSEKTYFNFVREVAVSRRYGWMWEKNDLSGNRHERLTMPG